MNTTEFVYWLQGMFELTDTKTLNENQVKIIKEHLKLVFEKKTPDISPVETKKESSVVDELSKIIDVKTTYTIPMLDPNKVTTYC